VAPSKVGALFQPNVKPSSQENGAEPWGTINLKRILHICFSQFNFASEEKYQEMASTQTVQTQGFQSKNTALMASRSASAGSVGQKLKTGTQHTFKTADTKKAQALHRPTLD